MTDLEWLDQQPLWLTSELAARGLTAGNIDALLRRGELVRLRRACYLSPKRWGRVTINDVACLQVIAHWRAGVVAGTPAAVYSHTSAARLHGLIVLEQDFLIHVTESSSVSSSGHARDVQAHPGWLTGAEVTQKLGLLTTSLERTAVDCSRILGYRPALVTTEHALKMGASLEGMKAIVASLANHKGVGNARRVVENASHLSESPGETLVLDTLRTLPVPMPEQQAQVSTRLGEVRLDFAWREQRAALMIGGWVRYGNDTLTATGLLRQRQYEEALVELGWTFLRVEWADLLKEAELKERILRHLRRAQDRPAA